MRPRLQQVPQQEFRILSPQVKDQQIGLWATFVVARHPFQPITALISAAVTGKIDVRHWRPPVVSAVAEA